MSDRPGRHLDRSEGGREAFDRGRRQFGEQRQRAQQRDLHDRHRRLGVQGEQGAAAGGGGKRQHDRDAEHREPGCPQVHEHRHQHRADSEPGHGEPFEKAEYLAQ